MAQEMSRPAAAGRSQEEVRIYVWSVDGITWRERVVLYAFALCYRPDRDSIPMSYRGACKVMPFMDKVDVRTWTVIVQALRKKGLLECVFKGNQWHPSEWHIKFLDTDDTQA